MNVDLETIETLLHRHAETGCEALPTRFDAVAAGAGNVLVLFGAGALGRRTLKGLRRLGLEPSAFADNRPSLWGTQVDGLLVLEPAEARRRYAESAVFVVTIFNGQMVRRQLAEQGIRRVLHFGFLYWKYPQEFLPYGGLADPEITLGAPDEVRSAFELWEDGASRAEFVAQLAWRWTLDSAALPPHDDPRHTYFPSELITLSANELFVDCGAFDGDTLRAWHAVTGGRFASYVGFEPDPDNFRRLRQCASSQPEWRDKVTLYNAAVGSDDGVVSFDAHGDASSTTRHPQAASAVRCMRLDSALLDTRASYVKMDVEGAELDVLAGGRELFRRNRPVLAVCAYHKPDDLWRIPLAIRNIDPGYRLYLRRYAEDCWELVCYAIPPERLVAGK